MEKLKYLKELKVSLSHAVVEIQITKCELEARGLFVTKNIQKILDDHKRELLEEAVRTMQEKMDRLSL